jgi:hypothetical protein
VQQVNGRQCSKRSGCLQAQHAERRSGIARQTSEREERHYRDLAGHEQLPEMGLGTLVGLWRGADERQVNQHDGERSAGHRNGEQGNGVLQQRDAPGNGWSACNAIGTEYAVGGEMPCHRDEEDRRYDEERGGH